MTQEDKTTPGDGTWQAPAGVTTVHVRCWGGGGAGGGITGASACGGGGAGGTYSEDTAFVVTPGNTYNFHVATTRTATTTSSAAANKGDVTWFSVNSSAGVVAIGGTGAAPQSGTSANGPGAVADTAGSFGTTIRAGGNGADGNAGADLGGGGGGGAGTTAVGGNATGATGGTGASLSGGNGATADPGRAPGVAGSNYGGAGSGASGLGTPDEPGGTGAQGRIELEYTAVTSIPHRAYIVDTQAITTSFYW